jgi:hypothetical protein
VNVFHLKNVIGKENKAIINLGFKLGLDKGTISIFESVLFCHKHDIALSGFQIIQA